MSEETNEMNVIELEPETLEQKVARLEGIIARQNGKLTATVETADGGPKTVKQLSDELRVYRDNLELQTAELRRSNDIAAGSNPTPHVTTDGQVEWRRRDYSEPPLYGDEAVAKDYFGLNRWSAWTAQQRAQARSLRQSDVDRLDPIKYFGENSSAEASELMRTNPALYVVLRTQAEKKGRLSRR